MKLAILFKTHFWDEVVERNFLLCKRYSNGCDIFILFDPDAGSYIPEPHLSTERIFYTPYDDINKLGLEWGMQPWGGFWYNGDYQQNLFIMAHPEYDYICAIENDVAPHISFAKIFQIMNDRAVDLIYDPQTQPNEQWSHLNGCVGYYDTNTYIHKGLFCVSFFSRRAAMHILRRRLEMSVQRRIHNLPAWPIGECVMVQEVFSAGMSISTLSSYCEDLPFYDWAPAYLPIEDDDLKIETFSHPITALNSKFISSNFDQDYHSLFSEFEVISGISRSRARRIADLEIYSRLFNSLHVQWAEDRWRPILQDADEVLDFKSINLLGGRTLINSDSLSINKKSHYSIPLIVSPLPQWCRKSACFLEVEDILYITLTPHDERLRLIFGSTQEDLPIYLTCTDLNGKIFPIKLRGTHRDMHFYEVELPMEVSSLKCVTNKCSVTINSIRLVDGSGRLNDWKK
ncbi:hypothetical protein [Gluconobacter sp. P1D12_c]|uniref:hypothetical protein n=1 Tax=Gluconobacter sp. P1D12_c TaxID=2762614 RepID=UPI001C0426EC|nr:hypothetical protein [Gluconobacter sp. P1D12_c]